MPYSMATLSQRGGICFPHFHLDPWVGKWRECLYPSFHRKSIDVGPGSPLDLLPYWLSGFQGRGLVPPTPGTSTLWDLPRLPPRGWGTEEERASRGELVGQNSGVFNPQSLGVRMHSDRWQSLCLGRCPWGLGFLLVF